MFSSEGGRKRVGGRGQALKYKETTSSVRGGVGAGGITWLWRRWIPSRSVIGMNQSENEKNEQSVKDNFHKGWFTMEQG